MSTKAEFRSRQLKRLQTAAKETQMAGVNLGSISENSAVAAS